jgi:uncharacterized membrane-anchored protein YitT (DUF2179 family)
MIFVGTSIYAFGFEGFIISNEIVPGGLTGIGSLIFYATKIPVSLSYGFLNVLLLLLALKILGKRFVVNSLFGIVSLTLMLMFFEWLLKGKSLVEGEPFMSVVIGGALCGGALGIIFTAGGSTGGTDIIGAMVNKYRNISIGKALLYCDFVIIASSYLIFHDIEKIVFGYVVMISEIYILEYVLNANNQSVQFLIISHKYETIIQRIMSELGRGCTILDGEGGYTKQPAKVIIVLAKKRESVHIFRIIKDVDNQAFISQSNVRGVYGEGFEKIKG